MSVVVGVVENGRVWIGGDSLASDDHVGTVRRDPKVFRLDNGILLGIVGDSRVTQVVRYAFGCSESSGFADANMPYLLVTFVPALRERISEAGVPMEEGEHKSRWSILLALHGHLYAIYDDFQIEETADGHNAIGCGYRTALGSLYTTSPDRRAALMCGRDRVLEALEATAHVDLHVAPPFTIEVAES